ncbi:ADP-ribosylglycohydrolase-domain-containing protein [Mycena haematopus]|nr:ADP-ribosylglycohydrolase-domain-containing protein [Mycena haematopus]
MASPMLHTQHLVPAPVSTKIRLALLATALCDALGGPAEFKPRFSFPFISRMKPNGNFSLGAGVWTDDTSMMLALARSLATYSGSSSQQAKGTRGGFDEADQLEAYLRWYQHGVLSAIGRCFDIGSTTRRALGIYKDALKASGALTPAETRRLSPAAKGKENQKRRITAKSALARIAREMSGDGFGGNGSLMRVLPVGLAYSRDPAAAAAYARRSSATTHPSAVCQAACAAWTECIARLVRSADAREEQISKLDVLHHFAVYPWPADAEALRTALAPDVPLPAGVVDPAAIEAHYTAHHPLMRLRAAAHTAEALAAAATPSAGDADTLAARTRALLPSAAALPSSGYVVHTLAAALYAFLATRTFEAGALLTANMGGDADTVAAVYGGLAGVWYATQEEEGAERLFWSPRVRAWRDALVRRDLIEESLIPARPNQFMWSALPALEHHDHMAPCGAAFSPSTICYVIAVLTSHVFTFFLKTELRIGVPGYDPSGLFPDSNAAAQVLLGSGYSTILIQIRLLHRAPLLP